MDYTRVGENGSLISGGQKQRIAIARAIYFRRNFVVLDEATSSLDTTTEKEIIRSIKMLKGKMTFIIIAHRLDTLRICDKILVMKKGAIVQEGSFADLEKNDRAFKKMIVNSKNI